MPYVLSGLVDAPIFNEQPRENDALYVCFGGELAGTSLALHIDCVELEGVHIDPKDPPLVWEYWSGRARRWQQLRLLDQSGTGRLRQASAADLTLGLNHSAGVYLHVPVDSRSQTIEGIEGTWLRVRYVQKPGQGYTSSPRITGLRADCIGATVTARQSQRIEQEHIGKATGVPGESFTLDRRPALRRPEPHVIEAQIGEEVTEWREVEDFSLSGETDRHFVINYTSGEVRFGPAVRARDGTERQHGAVPRLGADLRMRAYSSGGGIKGNVGGQTIVQMKTSLPNVAAVMNYAPASGGLDAETLEEAKLRALATLKRPVTAVTREDFERLALEVVGVGAARCIAPDEDGAGVQPGVIRLLLLPMLPDAAREITAEMLAPSPALLQAVSAIVEERKSLGTVVEMAPVGVTWAEIDAHIYVSRGVDVEQASVAAETRLRRLVHPTSGGPDGRGLAFGGAVTMSQIAGALQNLPGVVYVERVRLRRQGGAEELTRLQLQHDAVLALARCYVLVEVVED